MQAGRDLTLTAAQVTVKDNARLQAGRDLTLATLEESHGESIVRNKNNRHDLSTSTEIGSSIAADGHLTLIAGQDVTRAPPTSRQASSWRWARGATST